MIPVKLTLQGIYSYQEVPQTIDFGPLLKAGLFGIFGAVGSGKSTILEAISLALYGEIERLNRRDDRNYNMMNLKSDRLIVDFEFKNFDGLLYRFECEGKRNSRRYQEVNTYQRKASVWEDDKWVALDHASGERVTGMSYDNFKRTVIIPQGRFQEFLELTPGGRSQMLQELFSLDRFDLASANSRLIRQNSEEIQRVEGHLSAYEDVTQDRLKETRMKLDQLHDQIKKETDRFELIKKKTEDSIVLKGLYDRRKERHAFYQKMKANEKEIRQTESQLKKYLEARQEFAARMDQKLELEESIGSMEELIHNMSAKEARLRIRKEDIVLQYDRLRKIMDNLDENRKKAEEAELAAKLVQVYGELDVKLKRIKNGNKTILELKVRVQKMQAESQKLENQMTTDRKSARNRELLIDLRNSFNRKEDLTTRIKREETRLAEIFESIQKKKIAFRNKYQIETSGDDSTGVVNELNTRLVSTKEEVKEARKKWQHMKMLVKMAQHVEQLTAGEPCPLCGSTEHPAPAHFEIDSVGIDESGRETEAKEEQLIKIEKVLIEWDSLLAEAHEAKQKQSKEQERLHQLHQELENVDAFLKDNAKNFPGKEHVETAWQSSDELMRRINQNELKLKAINQSVETELDNLEKYQQKVNQLKSESDGINGEVRTLQGNLSSGTLVKLNDLSSDEWYGISEKLTNRIQKEKDEWMEVTTERDKIIKEHNDLTASIRTSTEFLQKEKEKLKRTRSELGERLDSSIFDSIEEVQQVLRQSPDVEKDKERLRNYDRDLHSVLQVLEELDTQIGDRIFNEDDHARLVNDCEKAEQNLFDLRDQKNYQVRMLEDLLKKWEKKKELKKTHGNLHERGENLKTLDGLFRGKGFVDYISTIYLREICEIANRRFRKLTNNHFALVLGEENQFQVLDYLHDGRIRSIKTLSGGQTFQASLCLALALAESLQNRHKSRQNFFFLDEGFGTLDGDALHLVMDSLKSLRQENRVVGVISHVESLQDEMDMYLRIQNDAEKGSRIEISYQL